MNKKQFEWLICKYRKNRGGFIISCSKAKGPKDFIRSILVDRGDLPALFKSEACLRLFLQDLPGATIRGSDFAAFDDFKSFPDHSKFRCGDIDEILIAFAMDALRTVAGGRMIFEDVFLVNGIRSKARKKFSFRDGLHTLAPLEPLHCPCVFFIERIRLVDP